MKITELKLLENFKSLKFCCYIGHNLLIIVIINFKAEYKIYAKLRRLMLSKMHEAEYLMWNE